MVAKNGIERSFKKKRYLFMLTFIASTCLTLCCCAGKNGDLRTSGISLPLTESRIIDLSLDSGYTGRKMPCKIYLPNGYGHGKHYPVWYALNGYSHDETMWINAGITTSADELIAKGEIEPIIMVYPRARDATLEELQRDFDKDGTFSERKIDQFICRELVPYIDSHFDTIRSAEGRYIGGLSMGGAIALRVALHHTDMFSKVGAYTPAVVDSDYSDKQLEKWLYPNDDMNKIDDIPKFDKTKRLGELAIYLDAGDTNDPFSVGVRSLYGALQKRGIRSEFHLYSGGHSLDHNKKDFSAYLKFYVAKE